MVILLRARKSVSSRAHGGARVIGIKIVRLEAGQRMRRIFLRRRDLHLVVAFLENLQGEEVAGVVVIGFLDHLDAGGLFRRHQLLRHGDGARRAKTRLRAASSRPRAPTRRKTS